MTGGLLGLIGAFLAGLASFLSPCLLPLVPAYLSFMTGLTTTELAAATGQEEVENGLPVAEQISMWDVLVPSLLFVLGFSLVFIAFGATASVLGQFLRDYRPLVEKIAGVLVFAFGFFLLGVIRLPWLYGEARIDLSRTRVFGRASAMAMGMAFAAGWSPCVGPFLGAILAVAGSTGSVAHGVLLLVAYSAGLGVPFVAVALLFGRVGGLLRWLARHALTVNRVAGVLLMAVGILIFTGRFGVLSSWLLRVFPGFRF